MLGAERLSTRPRQRLVAYSGQKESIPCQDTPTSTTFKVQLHGLLGFEWFRFQIETGTQLVVARCPMPLAVHLAQEKRSRTTDPGKSEDRELNHHQSGRPLGIRPYAFRLLPRYLRKVKYPTLFRGQSPCIASW